MKKALLTAAAILAVLLSTASPATARDPSLTIFLSGGPEANEISVGLSADGSSYVVDSIAPLEVGGAVCANPPDNLNEILCTAALVADFEINVNGGDDSVTVAKGVAAPVTLRGGPGNDSLVGGGAADKLIGGPGDDVLGGRGGNDWLLGGAGDDRLLGGAGDDLLRGGPGVNELFGGSGVNDLR